MSGDARTFRTRAVGMGIAASLVAALVSVAGPTTAVHAAGNAQLVVHVPGTARTIPSGAHVTLAGATSVTTAASSSDDYGWFAVADVPTGSTSVTVTSTGTSGSGTADLASGSEIWLTSNGGVYFSRAQAQGFIRVHFRTTGDPSTTSLTVTDQGTPTTLVPTSTSTVPNEAVFDVPVTTNTAKIDLAPSISSAPQGLTRTVDTRKWGEAWISDAWAGVRTSLAWSNGQAVIHYRRPDGNYTGFVLHTWNNAAFGGATDPGWGNNGGPRTDDPGWGVKWTVTLAPNTTKLPHIIHAGNTKDPGPDQFLDLAATGGEVWYVSGTVDVDGNEVYAAPVVRSIDGDLTHAKAVWLSPQWIAWPYVETGRTYALHTATRSDQVLAVSDGLLTGGGSQYSLVYHDALPRDLAAQFPYLATYAALEVPADAQAAAKDLLTRQLVVTESGAGGVGISHATGVQIYGILDDLYSVNSSLGVSWSADTPAIPTIRVWAPTSTRVSLLRYNDSTGAQVEDLPMTQDSATGVWSRTGDPSWNGSYYLFSVDVWAPTIDQFVTNNVTDPWSVSLSTNGTRTQIVNLADTALKPAGWDTLAKPKLNKLSDASIYEMHIRDFSIADTSVPSGLRGTYDAFTVSSNGTKRLRALAKSGLTHLHLLPSFDFATVNEDKSTWQTTGNLTGLGRNSSGQQTAVNAVRGADGYNWGYDPVHYTVPDGSYAVNPDGAARLVEYRRMVAAINGLGLRVVSDVVYNHTNSSGQNANSTLDEIVPGYYYRLNNDGTVANSTCCQNTATEHKVMAKLVRDSIMVWAKDYKIDGFRFDIMGHMPRQLLLQIRGDLNKLTPANSGVDGKKVILYGEGWDFGEVQGGSRFVQAVQANLAGTGIGTFDDRLRDAVRGGGPFDSDPRIQGFGSGLYTMPNGNAVNGSKDGQFYRLGQLTDNVRLGLTGELANYTLTTSGGYQAPGSEVMYNGSPGAGYTTNPTEAISYVDAHDGTMLYDNLAYKLKRTTPMADRARLQVLNLGIVLMGQGIPFFAAGSEQMHSKSLDKNSYDSGDWFNGIDWSMTNNGFGKGLPLKGDNGQWWSIASPLLADKTLSPSRSVMSSTAARVMELMKIRYSSPLFRLGTGSLVRQRLSFPLAGPKQTPGVIVMRLIDTGKGVTNLDPTYKSIIVVINASPNTVVQKISSLAKSTFTLHPVLRASNDPVVRKSTAKAGVFTVPKLTVAVFVEK